MLLKLEPFTDDQIQSFLLKLLDGDTDAAKARYELIRDIRDLLGLSRNPRMLSFIAGLDQARLIQARDSDPSGAISAATLYRELLNRWLVYEYDRSQPIGALPTRPNRSAGTPSGRLRCCCGRAGRRAWGCRSWNLYRRPRWSTWLTAS